MDPVRMSTDWPEHLRFIGRFVRNPRGVGAIGPSSRRLASAMVAAIAEAHAGRPRHIVELGPGTGAFTRAIVERLQPGDRFLGVELDPVFVETVRRQWPGVECVCASAESLDTLAAARHLDPVDHIVSGLPFATLPARTTRTIVEAIGRTLRRDGTFTTFHYAHSYRVPAAVQFRRHMSTRLASAPEVRMVAWNLPPALVLRWTNRGGA